MGNITITSTGMAQLAHKQPDRNSTQYTPSHLYSHKRDVEFSKGVLVLTILLYTFIMKDKSTSN